MKSESAGRSLMKKLFGLPQTRVGWWAIGFALGFAASFYVMTTWPSHLQGRLTSFWSYPPMGVVILTTAACGIASGVASVIGIFAKRERSLLVCLTLLLGAFVSYFTVGEICEGITKSAAK